MTPRYKLRTLLILLAVLPPLLWFGWTKYEAWMAERERLHALERARLVFGDDLLESLLRDDASGPTQRPNDSPVT